ncbi:hypothetical protein [Bacillus sp. EB600]|uniref:COG4705 family protein n=1 Tax=Bacillus sp. EB600 TaxID=2806345 RepID=UPI00210DA689|nr:hypothetical protein [Bacillus sp. EB600]MCQ6282267.1 hypothetical protein [Bacillus sp. EB600]
MNKEIYAKSTKQLLIKVPEITIFFWIIKLLSTAMGEAASDYLVFHINQYLAVILGTLGFIVALILQFKVKRYIPWVYWLTICMVSIFGTMAADVAHIVLLIPYWLSAVAFFIALIIIFWLWFKTENTLSIHSIHTKRRELFYWATVLATFAMGTSTGDLTAETFHMGFLASGIMFVILFAIPGLCYWLFGANEIAMFWIAYILTRPLGASFADWFGKDPSASGLGNGTGIVSVILAIFIVILVGYLSTTRKDVQEKTNKVIEKSNMLNIERES